jgi:HK97 family phage prohead protease
MITGHAAVFNTETDIGGYFSEQVAPGAFTRAIKEDDVRCLLNHDANLILGRNKAGTLSLEEDEIGLRFACELPDTQWGRDTQTSIARGDISQCSFGFQVTAEAWQKRYGKPDLRTISECRLFDVSPVTYPAYDTTDVALRTAKEVQEQRDPAEVLPDPLQAARAQVSAMAESLTAPGSR